MVIAILYPVSNVVRSLVMEKGALHRSDPIAIEKGPETPVCV
jgi:hypothetical protein